jgi:rubredoxin
MDEMECPYCGHSFKPELEDVGLDEGVLNTHDCPECGMEFEYYTNISYCFSTHKTEDS